MAWPKDKAKLINFLEGSMYLLMEVRGYLETRSREGDVTAGIMYQKLSMVHTDFRRTRHSLWEQLGIPGLELEVDGED